LTPVGLGAVSRGRLPVGGWLSLCGWRLLVRGLAHWRLLLRGWILGWRLLGRRILGWCLLLWRRRLVTRIIIYGPL
jgi:hypothetical protein